MRSMTIAYITNKMEENMKKFIITAIITVVLIIPVFADSALSGHVQSQVVYDFSEPENQTLKYNIKGSLASFTVDFTNLSFSKKGEKKPYVDISASAALQFNVGDHDIEWATYAFAIGKTDVVGVIKISKFNLVADVAGKDLVVDFLPTLGSDPEIQYIQLPIEGCYNSGMSATSRRQPFPTTT